jgi:hypothetical protein
MNNENFSSLEISKAKENFVKEFLYRYSELGEGYSSDRGHMAIGNLAIYLKSNHIDDLYAEIILSYEKSASGDTGRRTRIIIEEMRKRYIENTEPLLPELENFTITELLAKLNSPKKSSFLQL